MSVKFAMLCLQLGSKLNHKLSHSFGVLVKLSKGSGGYQRQWGISKAVRDIKGSEGYQRAVGDIKGSERYQRQWGISKVKKKTVI